METGATVAHSCATAVSAVAGLWERFLVQTLLTEQWHTQSCHCSADAPERQRVAVGDEPSAMTGWLPGQVMPR